MENVPIAKAILRKASAATALAIAADTAGAPALHLRVRSATMPPARKTGKVPSTAACRSPSTAIARKATASAQLHPKRPRRIATKASRHQRTVVTWSGPMRKFDASARVGSPSMTTTAAAGSRAAQPRRPKRAIQAPTQITPKATTVGTRWRSWGCTPARRIAIRAKGHVDQPEGIERERPVIEGDVPRAQGFSFEDHRCPVRVPRRRVDRGHIEERPSHPQPDRNGEGEGNTTSQPVARRAGELDRSRQGRQRFEPGLAVTLEHLELHAGPLLRRFPVD